NSTSGVGFDAVTAMGTIGSQGIFGLSGGLFTTDLASATFGEAGNAAFGSVQEVVTVTVGGNAVQMTYTSTDMGADTLADALNAAGAGSVEVAAETRASLEMSAIYGTAGFTTTGNIYIYDTNTGGTALGTIAIASGQTVDQVAAAINASFTSIVATFDTAGSLSLTDVEGNTLAFQ